MTITSSWLRFPGNCCGENVHRSATLFQPQGVAVRAIETPLPLSYTSKTFAAIKIQCFLKNISKHLLLHLVHQKYLVLFAAVKILIFFLSDEKIWGGHTTYRDASQFDEQICQPCKWKRLRPLTLLKRRERCLHRAQKDTAAISRQCCPIMGDDGPIRG